MAGYACATMILLAFDTSTELLRVGVRVHHADAVEIEAPGGAQASATLIPSIRSLLAGAGVTLAQLDAIVLGRGPGSFTGIRTACSVAQGLAFGSGVPVVPVDTLLAVAEDARAKLGATDITAVLDARMDEVYWGRYLYEDGAWTAAGAIGLGAPEAVTEIPQGLLAGNAFAAHAERLPRTMRRCEAAPTAAALLRLAPALIAAGQAGPAATATPLYIRDKVAQTTEERAVARASKLPAS
jgi:tRNA threonylcarbamoyladenosine biosynthesis protein TsaB